MNERIKFIARYLTNELTFTALCDEFGVDVAHLLDDEVADLVEERVVQSQVLVAVVDGTAHYLAQYVIAPLVAGQNAVRDGERGRTRVVRDDAAGELFRFG
jgi:hypothetical protein